MRSERGRSVLVSSGHVKARAHYLLLVVAGLFFAGFIHNTVTGSAHRGDTASQWTIIILAVGAYLYVRREERLRDELLEFLRANAPAIRAGTAMYRGHSISYATRLRTCDVVLSFLLMTFRLPSRPVIVGRESDRGVRFGSSLVTFVFGWWGLPWGPIWTVRALAKNLRGTDVISVGELIEGKSAAVVPVAASLR